MKAILTLVILIISQLAFGQDIELFSTTLPTTSSVFEEIDHEITITNPGIVPITDDFTIQVYLSTDNTFQEGTDIRLGAQIFAGLGAGEFVTKDLFLFNMPTSPGNYFQIFVIDYYNQITETDETNNQHVIPGIVINAADCDFITSLSLDKSTYTAGEQISADFTVSNIGSTNMRGALYVAFYASDDAVLSVDDEQLQLVGGLITGADNLSMNTSFFAPGAAASPYYIIGKVDEDGRFDETDEDNNINVQTITIQDPDIDLEITDIMNNSSYSSVSFFVTLRNNGTTGVGGFELSGFVPGPGGTILSGIYFDQNIYLEPGESEQFLVNTSTSLSPGIYPLVLTVNQSHTIVETDYANNTFTYNDLNIPPPPTFPSVTVNSIAFAGSYDNTDSDLLLNLNLTNSGTANFFMQNYVVEIKDATNTVVHTQNNSVPIDFSPGSSDIKTIAIALSAPLLPGLYRATLRCNGACNTSPATTTIDLPISLVQYTLTGTIQGEDGTPINHGSLFLYQKGDDDVVKFIQKVTPTSTSDFSFQIDNHQHTLYFIPDRVDYPGYVPTIYGKTLVLQESSFFTLTGNSSVVFEILSVQPMASGPGIINGTVTQQNPSSSPSGRIATTAALPLADVPVLLLSSSDDVVGYTYTNESGFYEFLNLPRADYQVIILRELDLITMPQPHAVTIASRNMTVDFELSPEAIDISDDIFYLNQVITFTDVPEVKFGQAPVALDAVSDSGLPISYSTSNSTIAEVVDGYVMINKPGSVTLTATQTGNDFYQAAAETQILTINKGDQNISFTALPAKTFGDAAFTPEITSSTIVPIELTSSDLTVASISGTEIVIHGAGEVIITAAQNGDDFYNGAEMHQTLTIAKASQTILFEPLLERDLSEGSFELDASTNSLLSVTFTSDNLGVATIEGNVVSIHKAGIAQITAAQNGNSNYESAPSVTRTLTVNQITGVIELDHTVSVYPNPVTDFIFLNNDEEIERIDAVDGLGRLIPEIWKSGDAIDFRNYATGMYTLKIKSRRSTQIIRIVKK